MKKTLFFILLHGISIACLAQADPVYIFQVDDTTIKRKYFNEALEKKNRQVTGLKGEEGKIYKDAYTSMFNMSKDLLLTSRSITTAEADNYIKAVVSKIVNANPELKGLDLRVVFSRDYFPNAFSIGDGTISFNAGLFVYLSNEAEMAFVLCHEIAHYYLNHSRKRIERAIVIANSDSLKKEVKRLSKLEYRIGEQLEKLFKSLLFDIHRHGRDGEAEADRVGLRFLKKTGYSGKGFITAMQLLDKVDDTSLFTPLQLQKTFSYTGSTFKERWIKKESIIFGAMNSDDATPLTKKERDSLKTHPDCTERIELLNDSALAISGSDFQVNEVLFQQLKEEFIPEIVEEAFKAGNIGFNLYLSLRMLQDGKQVPLAIFSIVRDLNLLYKKQKDHQMGLSFDSEDRRYSESYNSLLRMIHKIRLHEIADLTVSFCNHYKDQMKNYKGFAEEFEKARINQQNNK